MKIKTQDLTGTALDWAVAKCADVPVEISHRGGWVYSFKTVANREYKFVWVPSTDWSQAGGIIEQERISIKAGWNVWDASMDYEHEDEDRTAYAEEHGPTPLVAAMRCYVASKMGDEIEVPDEVAA